MKPEEDQENPSELTRLLSLQPCVDEREELDAPDGYAFVCPGCGGEANVLSEGYCDHCCKANQEYLDQHNAAYDRWRKEKGQ